MGCDIHIVVEKERNGEWLMHNTVHCSKRGCDRNYDRFARLAGVRGDGPEPRGLPSDVSASTQMLVDEWGDDGHSHSWLPLSEALALFRETERGGLMSVSEYDYFDCEMREPDDAKNYRVIFWFDN